MAYLNADIPPIYCKVRKEYLYDFKSHQGESEECVVFGLTSMAGAATLFHIMLPNGAVFFRLPISLRFSKNRMTDPTCPICKSTSYNCGTALVIILVFIALVI